MNNQKLTPEEILRIKKMVKKASKELIPWIKFFKDNNLTIRFR